MAWIWVGFRMGMGGNQNAPQVPREGGGDAPVALGQRQDPAQQPFFQVLYHCMNPAQNNYFYKSWCQVSSGLLVRACTEADVA